MSASSLQTLSQIAIAVGVLIGGLGGFGNYYFGKQAQLESARDHFQRSLRFHRLEGYWVEISENTYQLGLVATILNKDGTRAVVFEGVGFEGGFTLGGSGSATYQSLRLYNEAVTVHGNYFLSPGQEEDIHILLPSEVKMTIHGGMPGLQFNGTWTFVFEETPFPVDSPTVRMRDVLTMDDWRVRSAGS